MISIRPQSVLSAYNASKNTSPMEEWAAWGGQGGKGVLAFVGSSLKERDVKGGGDNERIKKNV